MKTDYFKFGLHLVCAVAILFNAFSVSLLKMDLEDQRDFIEKVFCINKDKPEMSCHGQCFINKQLKKEAEKQKESNMHSTKEVVMSLCASETLIPTLDQTQVLPVRAVQNSTEVLLTSKDLVDRLLRPPIV
ncbi:hypothetical protein [Flammeovirga sp. SubArs3]|uniref:hypothetical protein n=1 Tax=Flammeovirga sp. SubArs3 TaxID=2995316 RepID=UPI00248B4CE1|nr:hypothetical protein [Flammeovirga sp. SubArs3]